MTQSRQHHRPPLLDAREAYVAVTDAAYTAKAGDRVIGVNRAGAVTVTLPSSEVRPGRLYTVKDESGSASSNNVTVATEASETIDGSSTFTLNADYEAVSFYSDGVNWFVVPVVSGGGGGGGAITREGGNTTEATTTSTSDVDLLTASGLSIAAGSVIRANAALRKTTGAASYCTAGVKLNSTVVISPQFWSGSNDEAMSGWWDLNAHVGVTNYLKSGGLKVGSTSDETRDVRYMNSDGPTATITSVTVRGKTGNAAITYGADELHVYSLAVS